MWTDSKSIKAVSAVGNLLQVFLDEKGKTRNDIKHEIKHIFLTFRVDVIKINHFIIIK